jgi:hypothetical protein
VKGSLGGGEVDHMEFEGIENLQNKMTKIEIYEIKHMTSAMELENHKENKKGSKTGYSK